MAVTVLYPSQQTRALIVSKVLAGGTNIAWVVRKGIGFLWSGSSITAFVPQVAQVINSISNGYLVYGIDGIAATQNIPLLDTYAGALADDYALNTLILPVWQGPLLERLIL